MWLGPDWRRFSVPFTTAINLDSFASRLDIYGIVGQPLLIDNVSLMQVDSISYNATTADVLDLVNASSNARSFDCPTDRVTSCSGYIDTAGNKISWPVIVPPWSITALIWGSSPFSAGN
jgi:hypothetical protein